MTPKELADRNARRFQELMPRINASNDFFIRTTDPRHKARVQQVMQRVHDNGHVYKGLYEGWYCPRCADFKTEAEIGPDNTCPIHQIPLDARARGELVLPALGAFQEPLERALRRAVRTSCSRGCASTRRASFIDGGLQDISLSRGEAHVGRPVPWDPTHVFYVWFDALLNYYTALAYATRGRGPHGRVLAGDVPRHRQGHPEVPRGVLAGDADGRRPAAARAPLRPRLPADEDARQRAQDVQVARQRARPVRGHRPVRHRRAALLLPARRPFGRDGGVSTAAFGSATRASSPTSSGTSRAAARMVAPLLATARCPHARSTRCRGRLRRPRRARSPALLDRAELTQALEGSGSACGG